MNKILEKPLKTRDSGTLGVDGIPCFFCVCGLANLNIAESESSLQNSEPALLENLTPLKAKSKSVHCDKFVKLLCSENKNFEKNIDTVSAKMYIQPLTPCQSKNKQEDTNMKKNIGGVPCQRDQKN